MQERDAGWAAHIPAVTFPRRPGSGWGTVQRPTGGRTGWAMARACPYRPTNAREKKRKGRRELQEFARKDR